VERVEWWWNSQWTRLARHDAWLFTDGTNWRVETQQGGHEGGKLWGCTYDTEAAARAKLDEILTRTAGRWQGKVSKRPPS
jgi:hypothetical protein